MNTTDAMRPPKKKKKDAEDLEAEVRLLQRLMEAQRVYHERMMRMDTRTIWIWRFTTAILFLIILVFSWGCAAEHRRGSYIWDMPDQHRHAGDGKHHGD